jgi:hypothetical protein
MIEVMQGFPNDVVGVIARGRVRKQDYEKVLVPAVEDAVHRHGRVRLYYQLGDDFTGIDLGAAWEDLKIGTAHLLRWDRIAVVTDVDWIRLAVGAFGFLMPGKVRVFAVKEASTARDWIVAA